MMRGNGMTSFQTIQERTAHIRAHVLPDPAGQSTAAASAAEKEEERSFLPSSAAANRLFDSDFQTLLTVYGQDGAEFSISPLGERRVKRTLPRRGWFHRHEFVELLYVVEGSFDQILLGERRRFPAGTFVVTDQNCEHSDYIEAVDAAVLFLQIRAEYLDGLLYSYPQTDELHRFLLHALCQQKREQSFLELSYAPSGTACEDCDPHASALLEQLVREDLLRLPGSEHVRRGLLIRLLQRLCTDYTSVRHRSSQEGNEKALLYELERYIRLHDADVTACGLEQIFHYHRNYFNLILQKYRGQTFKKYLQSVRLDHARQLLAETTLPIRQIALLVGYENTGYFYRLFRERFGVPPRDVRK